jgi:diphthine synthase
MVLFLVGLGLGDEKDITVRGLEIVRSCSKLFLEHYTSILGVDTKKLEAFYQKEIILADRFMVEDFAEGIFGSALNANVALLVVGDPLCATTHTDMMIRARKSGIKVEVVHNASVMGAIASTGLQLYQFGQTVSVPFFDGEWRPDSFYNKIKYNQGGNMHTLVLLDIKVKEPDFDAMGRNQKKFLPPRFMTVNQAIAQMLEVEDKRKEGVCGFDHLAIGCARLGQPTQQIVAGTLAELLLVDFGTPLHSLVLCHSELHELEEDFLEPMRAPKVTLEQAKEAAKHALEEVAQLTRPVKEDDEDVSDEILPEPVQETTEVVPPEAPLQVPRAEQQESKQPAHDMDDDDVMELFGVSTADLTGTIESDDEA